MILNHLPIFAYSGVLKFDMKIFVNLARLVIAHLFTQGARRGHISSYILKCILSIFMHFSHVLVYFIIFCSVLFYNKTA